MTTTTHRIRAEAGPDTVHTAPEIAAIRLLSLLPGDWHGEVSVVSGGFQLDVTGRSLMPGDVRREVERALQDDALTGWRWVNRPP
jgi:hypothetical protein